MTFLYPFPLTAVPKAYLYPESFVIFITFQSYSFYSLVACLLLEIYQSFLTYKESMLDVIFYDLFHVANIIVPLFTLINVHSSKFICFDCYVLSNCVNLQHFLHSPVSAYLDCFHISFYFNSATMHRFANVFRCTQQKIYINHSNRWIA